MATVGINKGYGTVPVYDKDGNQTGTKANLGGTGGNIVTQPGWNPVAERGIGITPSTPMYMDADGKMQYGSDPNKAGTVTTGPNYAPVGSAAWSQAKAAAAPSPAQKLSTTIGSSTSSTTNPTDWNAVREQTLKAFDIEAATGDKQAEASALRRGIEGGVLGSVMGYQHGQNQIGRARLLADLLREQDAAYRADQDMQIRRESIAASERLANAQNANATWGDLAQKMASGSSGERNTTGDGGGTFGASIKYPTNSVAAQSPASAPAQDITRMTTAQLKSLRTNAYARKAGGEYSWLPYNSQTNAAIDAELARRQGNVDPTQGVAGLFTDAYGNPISA